MKIYTMWDSIDPAALKTGNPDLYAGYVGGRWPTYSTVTGFGKPVLSIAVRASQDAHCLDVEAGDATPAQVPAWLDRQYARGVARPVLYTSASQAGAVRAAAGSRPYYLWTAHYTRNPHLCGAACGVSGDVHATQWTDKGPNGQNVDQSLVSEELYNLVAGHQSVTATSTGDVVVVAPSATSPKPASAATVAKPSPAVAPATSSSTSTGSDFTMSHVQIPGGHPDYWHAIALPNSGVYGLTMSYAGGQPTRKIELGIAKRGPVSQPARWSRSYTWPEWHRDVPGNVGLTADEGHVTIRWNGTPDETLSVVLYRVK